MQPSLQRWATLVWEKLFIWYLQVIDSMQAKYDILDLMVVVGDC